LAKKAEDSNTGLESPIDEVDATDYVEENATRGAPSDYGLYMCEGCGQRVLGFDKENHIKKAHGGKQQKFLGK
jgi:hypothetical protein